MALRRAAAVAFALAGCYCGVNGDDPHAAPPAAKPEATPEAKKKEGGQQAVPKADAPAAKPADAPAPADAEEKPHEPEGVEEEIEMPDEAYTDEQEAEDAAKAGMDDEAGQDKDNLVDEWDAHMEGFVPELLLTFPLAAHSDEFFYEEIAPNSEPVLVRGGYFASASAETSSVEFSITDPKGDTIFHKKNQAEGLFHFVAKDAGLYTFIISNHKWMQEKMVTFSVGKGNQTHLQAAHLTTVEDHVRSIDKTLVDIQTESTYLWIRQKSHMKAVESIHTRVLAFCVVEFLVLLGVSGFQVYYIKGLLSDRRVL